MNPISRFVGRVRRCVTPAASHDITFAGNFASWDEAQRASSGYDAAVILERTRDAVLKVKRGDAVFERDSVLFDKADYAFPLLSGLLRASQLQQGRLAVIDFGGALGSTYFQCRPFLAAPATTVQWLVVEQPAHVATGRAQLEDNELRFFETVEQAVSQARANVLLLSSVLQYMPDPYATLERLLRQGIRHVIVDRTAFLGADRDRLTVQSVPAWIYPASYPAWFLSETRLRAAFVAAGYALVAEFAGADRVAPPDEPAYFKGFLFDRC